MNTEETQCAQLAVKNRREEASHFFYLGVVSLFFSILVETPSTGRNKERDTRMNFACLNYFFPPHWKERE